MIQSERTYLRGLEPEDVDVLYRWENDPDHWRVSGTKAPFSRHLLEQYVNSFHDLYAEKQLRLMICSQDDERVVGTIDLFDFDPLHARAGVGVLIGEKEDRRSGYAADALEALIRHAFDHLDLHQLYCSILEDNEESLQLFREKGFEVNGTRKEWVRHENHWKDELFLQLIRSEK